MALSSIPASIWVVLVLFSFPSALNTTFSRLCVGHSVVSASQCLYTDATSQMNYELALQFSSTHFSSLQLLLDILTMLFYNCLFFQKLKEGMVHPLLLVLCVATVLVTFIPNYLCTFLGIKVSIYITNIKVLYIVAI